MAVSDVRRCCGDIEPDIILIGNKTDCEEDRQVTKDEGQIKAIHLNAMFFEMNATTPAGINSVFDAIAERVHKQMEDPEPSDSGYESMSSSTMSSSGYGSQSSSVMHSPAIRLESPMNSPFISLEPSTPKKSRDCCTLL
uniref:small monomeric GTPase n=1 Tax=Panagrellus redivivus TaxID=6233 RepID=A0A7E4V6Y9_PANRE